MTRTTPRWREWHTFDRLARSGPIILGCNGSAASLRAIEAAPQLVNAPTRAVVAYAVSARRSRRSPSPNRDWDVLKADAYQLSASAVLDEAVRRGRETAWNAGLKNVMTQTITSDPVHALLGAALAHDATAIIVGVGGARPSRQVNRLAAALPDGVDLIATDGVSALIAQRRPRADSTAADYRPALLRARLASR